LNNESMICQAYSYSSQLILKKTPVETMETLTQNTPADFIEKFISSYEDQIEKIETVFRSTEAVSDSSYILYRDFELSLSELREERLNINDALRENLAKNGSLRKNDYDSMMNDIFVFLDEKEKDAEESLTGYIRDQRKMSEILRQGILAIKSTNQDGSKHKIEDFKKNLKDILATEQERKDLVIAKLLQFQNIHNRVTVIFRQMLEKGDSIHYKDIKEIKTHFLEEKV
jgi:hypothetical protein